jgi:DNA-binding transcriptional ArsR family regulator
MLSKTRRHEAETGVSGERPVPLDRIFHILRNQRRRRILDYLASNPTTTRSDLAEHVAALENDVSIADLTATQRKRVYVSFHQSHLPALDEAGALAYDRDRGTVERTPRTAVFLTCLDRAREPIDEATRSTRVRDGAVLLSGAVGFGLLGELGPLHRSFCLGLMALLAVGSLLVVAGVGR